MKSDEKPTKKPRVDHAKLTLTRYRVATMLDSTLVYGSLKTKLPALLGD